MNAAQGCHQVLFEPVDRRLHALGVLDDDASLFENMVVGASLLLVAGVAVLEIIEVLDMWRRDGEGGS